MTVVIVAPVSPNDTGGLLVVPTPLLAVLAITGVVVDEITGRRLGGLQILAAFARVAATVAAAVHLQFVWLQHVQLVVLLHVGRAQVLLGVVVPAEGAPLTHEAHADQAQQQDQEEHATHHSAHDGAQVAVGGRARRGGGALRRGAELGLAMVGGRARGVCSGEGGGAGGGGGEGGGGRRVWREERRRQEGGEEKGERLLDRYGKMEERKGEKRKNT